MSRVKILLGHTGSGKSEIALNLAIKEAKLGKKIALIDLDIVNPYFCIREHKEFLKNKYGINVISSSSTLVNAELMVIPKEVTSCIINPNFDVIIDVGGDREGAKVLRQYEKYLRDINYECYFVINPFRSNTTNLKEMLEYICEIQTSSNIRITKLINNSNLLANTTKENILDGTKIITELSNELNIPIQFTVIHEKIFTRYFFDNDDDKLIISSYINHI